MTSIILNSITGLNYPYDIYVCDVYGNNCGYISQINTPVPASVEIVLPPPFNMAPAVGIKIITSDGCEKFIVFDCIYITPTLTPTPTHTPTPTLPITIVGLQHGTFNQACNDPGTVDDFCINNTSFCNATSLQSSDGVNCLGPAIAGYYGNVSIVRYWNGTSFTGSCVSCLTPTPTPTPSVTPTFTPTPSITPTHTPTPTYPYVFDPYVYLVPEPQDTTSLTNLGTYMYNSGSTSFLGWGNGGVPSVGSYSNDLNVYIHYSGFTGGNGNFITNVSTLKGYIKQTTGTTLDTYGCTQDQYTFNTIELTTSQVNTNIQYFYSLWIPLNAVGGSMTNMTVDIGSNVPCSNDIGYNLIPDTILSSTNVVVSSGAVIPSNVYRVLWIDPSCLIPSSVPPPSLSSSIFFKGNTKT